jgi:hypothetical protein
VEIFASKGAQLVSKTPGQFATGINDTGGKFAIGVTGGK